MNAIQMYAAIDAAVRNQLNTLPQYRSNPNLFQFAMNEWSMHGANYVTELINKNAYPNGDINSIQASTRANEFLLMTENNFRSRMMNNGMMNGMMPNNGMMYGNMYNGGSMIGQPMYGAPMNMGGMMQNQFVPVNNMNYGGMYGGMYGGRGNNMNTGYTAVQMNTQTSGFGNNGNPYSTGSDHPITYETQAPMQQAPTPAPASYPYSYPTSSIPDNSGVRPMPKEEPVETEKNVQKTQDNNGWTIKRNNHPDHYVYCIFDMKKNEYAVTDYREPVAFTEVKVSKPFTDDIDVIKEIASIPSNDEVKMHQGGELMDIEYPAIQTVDVSKEKFKEFCEFLKTNIDINNVSKSPDHHVTVKWITDLIRSFIADMTVKESNKIIQMILDAMNIRGCSGVFSKSDPNYQVIFHSLDDIDNAEPVNRVFIVLLQIIKELQESEVCDQQDPQVRDNAKKIVSKYYHLDDLDDVTDQELIKNTVDEIDKDLTIVQKKRKIYYVHDMTIHGVIRGGKIDPAYSPIFSGTPDNGFEYLISQAFSEGHIVQNPIKLYAKMTPNILMAYEVGQTLEKEIRLSPCRMF